MLGKRYSGATDQSGRQGGGNGRYVRIPGNEKQVFIVSDSLPNLEFPMKNDEMEYSFLQNNRYCLNEYCLVPLREQDVELIRKWRNDQIHVLRQKKPLTEKEQHNYFSQVILKSFNEDKPKCILFSFLFKNNCIGYGGFVNINWNIKSAELSFLLDTKHAQKAKIYQKEFSVFLELILGLNTEEIKFEVIATETYDIRPLHIKILEDSGFKYIKRTRSLKKNIDGKIVDSIFHEYTN